MRKIPNLRWWIVALLFASTVINYVDRQSLSILAGGIQRDLGMSDMDYARVVQAFLLAYTIAYLFAGRITDRLGTRWSMAVFIGWWSVSNFLTAFARSAFSLGFFRFLLGLGEAGNYTAAPKAVSEWIQPKDRGLAVGIYTAGATLGATLSPPLLAWLAVSYGWRAAFIITAALGFLWLAPWFWLYHPPWEHPRVTEKELASAPPRDLSSPRNTSSEWVAWKEALLDRRVWLLMLSRLITDPVWYFYLFWFAKYLTDARGLDLVAMGKIAWVVYLAADIGSIIGGWASGLLIRRGLQPVASRLRVMTAAVALIPLGGFIALRPPVETALLLGGVVAFCHLTWQVTMGALIVDLWSQRILATVFGLVAAGSGLGGFLFTDVVGHLVTTWSYAPVFALMTLLHPCALAMLWFTIRPGAPMPGNPARHGAIARTYERQA
jgi:ACS family hexuronate transporter-like MFS transporter